MATLSFTHKRLRKMYDDELEYQFELRDEFERTLGRKRTPELNKLQESLTKLIQQSCKRAIDLDEVITDQNYNQNAAA